MTDLKAAPGRESSEGVFERNAEANVCNGRKRARPEVKLLLHSKKQANLGFKTWLAGHQLDKELGMHIVGASGVRFVCILLFVFWGRRFIISCF